jgi:hypothetical protein
MSTASSYSQCFPVQKRQKLTTIFCACFVSSSYHVIIFSKLIQLPLMLYVPFCACVCEREGRGAERREKEGKTDTQGSSVVRWLIMDWILRVYFPAGADFSIGHYNQYYSVANPSSDVMDTFPGNCVAGTLHWPGQSHLYSFILKNAGRFTFFSHVCIHDMALSHRDISALCWAYRLVVLSM